MARPRKYATEEERKAAQREQARLRKQRYREKHGEREKADKVAKRMLKKMAELLDPQDGTWEPQFVGVDGESFVTGELLPDGTPKQAYVMLYRSDMPYVLKPKTAKEWREGLSTARCLDYLSRKSAGGRKGTAIVGFFLNFDFEWILKDLSQDEYKRLQKGETIEYGNGLYKLTWIPSKFLNIERMIFSDWMNGGTNADNPEKPPRTYTVRIMDTQGFFQSSFISALEKWGFKDDPRLEIIRSGKAARGGFERQDWDEVAKYNSMELELLCELMQKVYTAFKEAYREAGLSFNRINAHSWSGPGVFANDFLRQTMWAEEHPPVASEIAEQFWKDNESFLPDEVNRPYPFSMAYYGGRIELSTIGRCGNVYNYDINSAYPYALSLLPAWSPDDFVYRSALSPEDVEEIYRSRRMGMYRVLFTFPDGWDWYPFPVRLVWHGSPNVFYPFTGDTWVMSPELFAMYDTLTPEERQRVVILSALELKGTEGYGDALRRMPEERLCVTARYTLKMADIRLKLKKTGGEAEKGLKLILNSEYGKTVQQVGSARYFSDFASAWITSVCRSLLWRALAPEKDTGNIIMTMTDGLYSKVPLRFCEERVTPALGDWEPEAFEYFETFKPGVYRYVKGGKMSYKVRGFLAPTPEEKERLFAEIDRAMREPGYVGSFPSRNFQSRNITLDGWSREAYRYQFYEDDKEIKSDLSAKRDTIDDWKIPDGAESRLFPPKKGDWMNVSHGYKLKFQKDEEDILPAEDTPEAIQEFLARYDAKANIETFLDSWE
jgi:hypothetical protein